MTPAERLAAMELAVKVAAASPFVPTAVRAGVQALAEEVRIQREALTALQREVARLNRRDTEGRL